MLTALAVIAVAERAGFSLAEITTLMYGFSDTEPPSERWKALARDKLVELDERMAQLAAMQALLREGLECDCLRLADCGVLVTDAGPTETASRGGASPAGGVTRSVR